MVSPPRPGLEIKTPPGIETKTPSRPVLEIKTLSRPAPSKLQKIHPAPGSPLKKKPDGFLCLGTLRSEGIVCWVHILDEPHVGFLA